MSGMRMQPIAAFETSLERRTLMKTLLLATAVCGSVLVTWRGASKEGDRAEGLASIARLEERAGAFEKSLEAATKRLTSVEARLSSLDAGTEVLKDKTRDRPDGRSGAKGD